MKKNDQKKPVSIPAFQSAIAPDQLAIGIEPKAAQCLFEGRSPIAREYYERDVARIRESTQIRKIEPRFHMADPDQMRTAAKNIDLRKGEADFKGMLPKAAKKDLERTMHPHHDPEKALNAAMEKLNGKKLK